MKKVILNTIISILYLLIGVGYSLENHIFLGIIWIIGGIFWIGTTIVIYKDHKDGYDE